MNSNNFMLRTTAFVMLTLSLPGCLTDVPKSTVLADGSVTDSKLATGINIAGGTASFSGNVTMNNLLSITKTSTGTEGANIFLDAATLTVAPTAGSATNFYAATNIANLSTAQAVTGESAGDNASFINSSTGTIAIGYGVKGQAVNAAANPATITSAFGVFGRALNNGTGTMTTSQGVYGDSFNNAAGTITNAFGVRAAIINNNAAATITTAFALSSSLTNLGTVTTYHGLHLSDPGTGIAVGKYNIFSDGNVQNYIRGPLGINQLTPAHTIDVVGDAGLSTGTAWTNTSDIRLKDVRGKYEFGLDEIIKLNVIRFNYKVNNPLKLPSDKEIIGFVAQEVQKVIPDAVKTRPDGYLELNVDPIHWAVVNAVKELYGKWLGDHEQLEALKAENNALKERLNKIEQALAAKAAKP